MKVYVTYITFLHCLLSFVALGQDQAIIYFQNDAHAIQPMHQVILDSIIQANDQLSIKLSSKGYANAYGRTSYNKWLSKKRASAVAEYFENAGLVVDTIQGLGEMSDYSYISRKVVLAIHKKSSLLQQDSIPSDKTDLTIDKLLVGEKIVFKNLNFVGGTDVPLFKSQAYLIELFEYLRDHPKLKVKFIGHICCHGSMDPETDGMNTRTNQRSLSRDRAKMVYDYMVNGGINMERLSYEGRAFTEPLGKVPEEDRRVEIELISNE